MRSGAVVSAGVGVGTDAVRVTSVGGFKLAFSDRVGAVAWYVGPLRYACIRRCVCESTLNQWWQLNWLARFQDS